MYKIFFVEVENNELPKQYEYLSKLISETKYHRINKYRFSLDIKLSLYADLLVRYQVCKIYNLRNAELSFSMNRYGKPYLETYQEFKFNISHTHNAIVIGVSNLEIGIDIEKIKLAHYDVAKNFFKKEEVEYIYSEVKGQEKRFYEVWTKKEAYIKYTGKGLNLALDSFNILSLSKVEVKSYDISDYIISCCLKNIKNEPEIIKISEEELIYQSLTSLSL